jgi:amino acid adenylation domain-containing protein
MAGLILDFFEEQVMRRPDAEALVVGEQRRTWGQLSMEVRTLARVLREGGVAPGDRVIIFLESGIEAVVALWAAHMAGAVVCVINPHTRPDRLAFYLRDLEAVALITHKSMTQISEQARAKAPDLKLVLDKLPAPDGSERTDPKRAPTDLAQIIYTSGTTGEAKGVALTHANMTFVAGSTCQYLGLETTDVLLCALPLSFSYGLYQVLTAARVGARVVLERNFAFPVKVLERMATEKATSFAGVPTLFATFAEMKSPPPFDLSSVRIVTNAAAALPERLVPYIAERFPNARFFSMYGQTECMRISYLPPELAAKKPRSVGVPIPGTSFEVVDEAGLPLPPGVTGQLVVQGPHVMQGYWKRPEATLKKISGGPEPEKRKLWTGDQCQLDADGHLYVVGRQDDVLKVRGEKVAPLEVERALVEIPGVREAAVIGVDDPLLGQAVKACLVLSEGALLTERQVILECQKRLEPHLVPKHVAFLPELPRNPSGKVLKAQLQ